MIPYKIQVICASCGASATNLGSLVRISVSESVDVASASVRLLRIVHPRRATTGAALL